MANASEQNLAKARVAWRQAHLAWRRFDQLLALTGLEENLQDKALIDATPMLPGYLDHVPDYPASGLVYSETPLSAQFLQQEHQSTDPLYLTLGFHPLHLLLFGSVDSGRSLADLQPTKKTQANDRIDAQARRRQLLQVVTEELVRTIKPHCQDTAITADIAALQATVMQQRLVLGIRRQLEALARQLALWQANPAGEDHNGLPVGHDAAPALEFTEWQGLISDLRQRWLPLAAAALGTGRTPGRNGDATGGPGETARPTAIKRSGASQAAVAAALTPTDKPANKAGENAVTALRHASSGLADRPGQSPGISERTNSAFR